MIALYFKHFFASASVTVAKLGTSLRRMLLTPRIHSNGLSSVLPLKLASLRGKMSRAVSSSYCIYPTRPQVEDSPQGSVLDPQHFCSLDPKRHDSIRNYLSNWGKFRSTSLATFPLLHKWLQTIVLRGITESRRVLSGMLIRRCQLIRNRLELEIGKTLHSVRPSDSKQPPVVMFDVDKRYVEAFGIQERGQLHEWVNMALC